MKTLKTIISSALMLVLTACSSDEPAVTLSVHTDKMGEIECVAESGQQTLSRTYFEYEENNAFLWAKWTKDDQIAMCFDDSNNARRFNILSINGLSAKFLGLMPDNYSNITAIYPFDIYQGRSSSAINIKLPESIRYDSDKMLFGTMPMFANGIGNVLNFYNLMGVIKISILGKGLLRSVSVSSPDGQGLSGTGHITLDHNAMPKLSVDDTATGLTVNLGAMLLSEKVFDILIPIPATTYPNGLTLEFAFEGKTETRVLAGPLHFERSVLRAVKPYHIEVPFDFNSYQTNDNEIWYKSQSQQAISNEKELGMTISTHSFSSTYGLGVITTESPIVKICGQIFKSPDMVTFVKLPQSVEDIGYFGMAITAIESFEAPKNLKILRDQAFDQCMNLKRVVLNDGLESIGGRAFSFCPNLEYVYIPKSVSILEHHAFYHSTSHLDQWYGDSPFIDADRHTLYNNSSSGDVVDIGLRIDNIAGCNLTEYEIPHQAIYIEPYAFLGCQNLKKLIINENFKIFAFGVFTSLPQLETIISHATTPPRLLDSDEECKSESLKQIFVPKASVDDYKQAPGWKNFADKIVAL